MKLTTYCNYIINIMAVIFIMFVIIKCDDDDDDDDGGGGGVGVGGDDDVKRSPSCINKTRPWCKPQVYTML